MPNAPGRRPPDVLTALLLLSGVGLGVWAIVGIATGRGAPWQAVAGVGLAVIGLVRMEKARSRRHLAAAGDERTTARVERGEGMSLDALAARLGTTADELRRAEPAYRRVRIPKKRGGFRNLDIPDDATKALQRRLLRRVLVGLSAHPAATGFEHGKTIVDNAAPHSGSHVVIRMDVVDFFPSTKSARVLRYFQWVGWGREAAEVLTKLTTWGDGLPQGAPTSPRLSNLVNYYLDVQLAAVAKSRKGRYTRYADDITISLDADLRVRDTIQAVVAVLRFHGYRMHKKEKLRVMRRHQRQYVTGLVVNDTVRLPREIRRRLRATCHRLEQGLEPTQGADVAAGWISYARMVERLSSWQRGVGEPDDRTVE
jgi:RNA-directed DNA polymerase